MRTPEPNAPDEGGASDRLHLVSNADQPETDRIGPVRVTEDIDETDRVPRCGVDNVIELCMPLTCTECGFETEHMCPRCEGHP